MAGDGDTPRTLPDRRRPPRPACPSDRTVLPRGWRRVWVPFVGWKHFGPDDRERVDRLFQKPMMVLALFALPVFAHEFILPQAALEVPAVTLAVEIALLLIWLAFTIEFVVKIAIAESRPKYALKNWLDLFIILLPFLRPLRGLAMARSLRLARFISVFGVRGAAMKLLRTGVAAVIGWEFLRRWTRAADAVASDEQRERQRLESLSRRELLDEAMALTAEVRRLEAALMAGRNGGLAGGDDALQSPPPCYPDDNSRDGQVA